MFNIFKRKAKSTNPITKTEDIDDLYKQYERIFSDAKEHKVDMALYENELKRQQLSIKSAIGSDGMAMDSTSCVDLGVESLYLSDALITRNSFKGFAYLALHVQIPYILNTTSKYAQDIMRKGFQFISTDPKNDKIEDISKLTELWKEYDCDEVLLTCARRTLELGGCNIYPIIDGMDKLLDKKLIISKETIKPNSLKSFTIIEPTWCSPIQANYNNPLQPDFYKPSLYSVMGTTVHESRLFKCIFEPLPQQLQPMYQFYGKSLTDKMLDSVRKFVDASDTVIKIMDRYNTSVLKIALSATSNPSSIMKRVKDFIAGRNNFGVFMVDKANEDFEQIQMTLAGLDDLLSRYAEFMCIDAQMSATKLLGIAPKGFNTNDESGETNYYDNVDSIRTNNMKPIMLKMLHLIMLNEGMDIDHTINIQFGKLKEPTPLEQSQINETNSRTDVNYINAGAIDNDDIRAKIATSPDSGYNSIELDDDEND